MSGLFGTDGVRGIVGEKITEKFVYDLSKSVAVFLNKQKMGSNVLLCHDTRVTFKKLEEMVLKGLCEFGINVVCGGIVPTPAVHYLTKENNFDLGIMITASHNPAEFNGIKLITGDGLKFSDHQEEEITKIYENINSFSFDGACGKVFCDENLKFKWADWLLSVVGDDFSGIKIALDCANGASYFLAPYVFKKLGAEVISINAENKGRLINFNCGSTHLGQISKTTKKNVCDLGFAFDGDADRVNAVFKNGKQILGEELLFLCCMFLKNQNRLKGNKIITPYVSNCGIDKSLSKFKIDVIRCDVGGKSIQQNMLEKNICFGAEDNGHIVWGDYNKCSDGLLTALFLTKLYKNQNFEEMLKDLKLFKQEKITVPITEEQTQNYKAGKIDFEIENLKKGLKQNERIIVRLSGTEPIMRIVVEGENLKSIKEISRKVENLIKSL